MNVSDRGCAALDGFVLGTGSLSDRLPIPLAPREGVALPLVCPARLLLPDAPGLRHRGDLQAAIQILRFPERLLSVLAVERAEAHAAGATNAPRLGQRQGRDVEAVYFDRGSGARRMLVELLLQARWNWWIARLELQVRRREVAGLRSRFRWRDRDCCKWERAGKWK